jgi:hypothetical protein
VVVFPWINGLQYRIPAVVRGKKTPEGGFQGINNKAAALNGDKMDKVIARLAEAGSLRGVIDNAHFSDEAKLGKGKKMVDKLSGLIAIFRRPELDFMNAPAMMI